MKHGVYVCSSEDSYIDVERLVQMKQGKIPEVISVYGVVPSNFDPGMAPPGRQMLLIGTWCSPDPAAKEIKMLQKKGFSFVEVLLPCPEIYGRHNKMRSGLEMMSWFRRASVIDNFSDPSKAEITSDRIVVGEFVDTEKLSYEKMLHEKISKISRYDIFSLTVFSGPRVT
jgi:phytoene dehydrogenase-like protein